MQQSTDEPRTWRVVGKASLVIAAVLGLLQIYQLLPTRQSVTVEVVPHEFALPASVLLLAWDLEVAAGSAAATIDAVAREDDSSGRALGEDMLRENVKSLADAAVPLASTLKRLEGCRQMATVTVQNAGRKSLQGAILHVPGSGLWMNGREAELHEGRIELPEIRSGEQISIIVYATDFARSAADEGKYRLTTAEDVFDAKMPLSGWSVLGIAMEWTFRVGPLGFVIQMIVIVIVFVAGGAIAHLVKQAVRDDTPEATPANPQDDKGRTGVEHRAPTADV